MHPARRDTLLDQLRGAAPREVAPQIASTVRPGDPGRGPDEGATLRSALTTLDADVARARAAGEHGAVAMLWKMRLGLEARLATLDRAAATMATPRFPRPGLTEEDEFREFLVVVEHSLPWAQESWHAVMESLAVHLGYEVPLCCAACGARLEPVGPVQQVGGVVLEPAQSRAD